MLGSYYSILLQNREKYLVHGMQKILTRLFTTVCFSFFRFTRINICAAESVAGSRSLMASQGKYVVVA